MFNLLKWLCQIIIKNPTEFKTVEAVFSAKLVWQNSLAIYFHSYFLHVHHPNQRMKFQIHAHIVFMQFICDGPIIIL